MLLHSFTAAQILESGTPLVSTVSAVLPVMELTGHVCKDQSCVYHELHAQSWQFQGEFISKLTS